MDRISWDEISSDKFKKMVSKEKDTKEILQNKKRLDERNYMK